MIKRKLRKSIIFYLFMMIIGSIVYAENPKTQVFFNSGPIWVVDEIESDVFFNSGFNVNLYLGKNLFIMPELNLAHTLSFSDSAILGAITMNYKKKTTRL